MTLPDGMEAQWREFLGCVEKRLEAGAKEYGSASLRAPPKALAGEVMEELMDVMGWGFLLWMRMKGIEERLPNRTQPPVADWECECGETLTEAKPFCSHFSRAEPSK